MSITTERKLVTALFCDVVGSTELGERLDPEALQSVQRAYFDRMRAVVEHFGGTVEKFAGDAVVAVFGVPASHEDDAERAVRCGLEMRHAVVGLVDTLRPQFGVELEVRIGIQTGEALVGGTGALATGDVMNTAARLEQGAGPGEILVGRETMRLTTDAVEYAGEVHVEAKGKGEPVPAWPAMGAARRERRLRAPLVGRTRELELLAGVLERAIAERESQAVLVLGEPGIGKTRLAEEFADRARGRAVVLRGACVAYGEGSSWLPLAEALRQEVGIGEEDDEDKALSKLKRTLGARHPPDELRLLQAQLAPLAGAARAAAVSEQELLWGLRRYLEGLASVGPAVLVLDDLHWADNTFLGAVQELLQTIASVPLTVVLQGRPELLERVTELLANERATVLRLGALSEQESLSLVDNLATVLGSAWAGDVRRSIVERAEGSPLFLEEVAAMASEEGAEAGVPRSLRALIGARLDLLPPEAKRVAQSAAVVGDVFWDGSVAALVGGPEGAVPALRRLRTGGFVEEEPTSAFLGQRQFRFHHALLREVTYESVPKVERSDLHRRAAAWLGEHAEARPELTVAIANHLERALALLRDVAPFDAALPELAEAAVDALRRGATWAGATASVPRAIALLRRAVSAAEGNPEQTQLATAQLAAMLARSGAVDEGIELAESILAGATTPEATALASLALAEAARSRADPSAMTEAGTRTLEIAQSLGLLAVEAEAHDLIGLADTWAGRLRAAVEHRRRATEIALELGDVPLAAWSMAGYNAISLLNMGNLAEAERQAEEAIRLARECGSIRALESAHTVFGFLRRTQDRLEEALEHARARLDYAEKLGERLWLFNSLAISLAGVLIDLNRLEQAWACTERALAISQGTGERSLEPVVREVRVEILLAWGRIDEAAAEAIGLDSLSEPFPALAELRAAQGRHVEAEALWRRVLDGFAGSDDRLQRAEAMTRFVRFLTSLGRLEEARATLDEARALVAGSGAHFHERLIREAEAAFP